MHNPFHKNSHITQIIGPIYQYTSSKKCALSNRITLKIKSSIWTTSERSIRLQKTRKIPFRWSDLSDRDDRSHYARRQLCFRVRVMWAFPENSSFPKMAVSYFPFVFATFVLSCLSAGLLIAGLATENWVSLWNWYSTLVILSGCLRKCCLVDVQWRSVKLHHIKNVF